MREFTVRTTGNVVVSANDEAEAAKMAEEIVWGSLDQTNLEWGNDQIERDLDTRVLPDTAATKRYKVLYSAMVEMNFTEVVEARSENEACGIVEGHLDQWLSDNVECGHSTNGFATQVSDDTPMLGLTEDE